MVNCFNNEKSIIDIHHQPSMRRRTSQLIRLDVEKMSLTGFAVFLIKCYKKFISPMLGDNCRFIPSCSEYAMEAYSEFGFIKGSYLVGFRLLRCAPWCKGGYDPVPKNKKKSG